MSNVLVSSKQIAGNACPGSLAGKYMPAELANGCFYPMGPARKNAGFPVCIAWKAWIVAKVDGCWVVAMLACHVGMRCLWDAVLSRCCWVPTRYCIFWIVLCALLALIGLPLLHNPPTGRTHLTGQGGSVPQCCENIILTHPAGCPLKPLAG